jgi:hypothetical protein
LADDPDLKHPELSLGVRPEEPLTAINDVFDRLEHGKVAGRVVLDFVGAAQSRGSATSGRQVTTAEVVS